MDYRRIEALVEEARHNQRALEIISSGKGKGIHLMIHGSAYEFKATRSMVEEAIRDRLDFIRKSISEEAGKG